MSINTLKKNRGKLYSILLAVLLLTTSMVTFIAIADTDPTQEPNETTQPEEEILEEPEPPEGEEIECRQDKEITIHAYKIICESEYCLPNWGDKKADNDISESTIQQFIEDSNGCCELVCGWEFEYGYNGDVEDPGRDHIGKAGGNWITFDNPTDTNGKTTQMISGIPADIDRIWIREILKDDYLIFSSPINDDEFPFNDVSAELCAHGDNFHYDNYEYFNIQDQGTYYVVAFNTKAYDITGTIWQDNNPVNHMQDAEPGINDVVVELYTNNNLIDSTLSDANGHYSFTNLPAGTYTVKIADSNFNGGVLNNIPDHQQWHQVDKDIGTDDIDSDGNMGTHDATITLGPSADLDFGYYLTCVDIMKTGPEEAYAGDTVVYTYTVTNCGDIILHGGCDVYDDLINPETPINHIVPPGEIWEFTQEYIIPEDACGDITNIATAIGHPKHPINGYVNDVIDEDTWTIDLLCNPENLIENGGFELPLVSGNWDIFNIIDNPELKWTVVWRDGQYQEPANLELQKNHLIDAHSGDQYAELDSDYDGPNGDQNGEAASVSISQTVSTCPDQLYNLTFYFAPRENQDASQNKLLVTWNGENVDDLDENNMGDDMPISRDGNPSEWTRHTYHIKADTDQVTITFTDMGESNSFGTFLDDVSLQAICGEEDLTYDSDDDDSGDDEQTNDDNNNQPVDDDEDQEEEEEEEEEENDDENTGEGNNDEEETDEEDDQETDEPIELCCVIEETNGDTHIEDPRGNGFQLSLLSDYSNDDDLTAFISNPENLDNEQTNIQQWDFCEDIQYEYLKLEWFEYVGKEAAYTNIFGYWLDQESPVNPDPLDNGFIPLFKNGTAASSPQDFSPGDKGIRLIPITSELEHISFGILSANTNIAYSSINDTNIEAEDHVLVYKLKETETSLKYLLLIEDWDRDEASGNDFDDFIVILNMSCTNEGNQDDIDNDEDGYTENEGDCDDNDPTVNPGMPEICGDEIDNDCDGYTDEGCNEEDDDDDDETDDDDDETDDDDDETDDDDEESTKTTIRSSRSKGRINTPPTAVITEPYTHDVNNQPLTLDGSNSHDNDPDDRIINYEWNLGDGTIVTGETISHIYENPGKYYVTLTVQDNHGTHGSTSKTFDIFQPNRPPQEPTILGFFSIPADETYSFAALSTDPDGDDIKYIFDWGDDSTDESDYLVLPPGSAFNELHSWDNPGDYTLTVTVTDGELSSSSEVQIKVEEANIEPMYIYAGIAAAIIGGLILIGFIIRRRTAKPTA